VRPDSQAPDGLPCFEDLPRLPGSEERHTWDVWGRGDELGAVNLIGPEQVRSASSIVRSGLVVPLSAPLTEPDPGLFPARSRYQHVITKTSHGRDDHLDGFFPQFSSQWDGLRHVRYRQHGFWGGRQDGDIDDGGALGIEHWARHGIITRGVLIDAKHYYAERGTGLAPDQRRALRPADLDEILESEGARIRPGDAVIIRTGWLEWYLTLGDEARGGLRGSVGRPPNPLQCPGLDAGAPTAAWLWDHRVAAVASDNPALEALPVDRAVGFLHYRLIPLLGLPIGEFWALGDLARACQRSGQYDFMLLSAPLYIPGGVGSPANAYAVL
jgi:Putative cyclase